MDSSVLVVLRMSMWQEKSSVCYRNGTSKTKLMWISTNVMHNPVGEGFLFDRRKDSDLEPMSEQGGLRVLFICGKGNNQF